LQEFPTSLVRKANDFYLSLLQEQEFVDLKTAKTKTEFAYTTLVILPLDDDILVKQEELRD
jgi:hypothetical protein